MQDFTKPLHAHALHVRRLVCAKIAVAAKVNKALIVGFSDQTYNNDINNDIYDDIEIISTSWLIDLDPVESSNKLIDDISNFLKK